MQGPLRLGHGNVTASPLEPLQPQLSEAERRARCARDEVIEQLTPTLNPLTTTSHDPHDLLIKTKTSQHHSAYFEMRFSTGIAVAALSGLTTAAIPEKSADKDARVYHLMSSSRRQQIPQDTPELPKEVARHILLQRVSGRLSANLEVVLLRTPTDGDVQTSKITGYGSDLRDLPESVDTDAAVSYIARYGKKPLPLFSQDEKTDTSQLVVILEGATPENVGPLVDKLDKSNNAAGFVIPNPPSAVANGHLMDLFESFGAVPSPQRCDLESAINPFDSNCWSALAAVLRFDLKKVLIASFPRLSPLDSSTNSRRFLLSCAK